MEVHFIENHSYKRLYTNYKKFRNRFRVLFVKFIQIDKFRRML